MLYNGCNCIFLRDNVCVFINLLVHNYNILAKYPSVGRVSAMVLRCHWYLNTVVALDYIRVRITVSHPLPPSLPPSLPPRLVTQQMHCPFQPKQPHIIEAIIAHCMSNPFHSGYSRGCRLPFHSGYDCRRRQRTWWLHLVFIEPGCTRSIFYRFSHDAKGLATGWTPFVLVTAHL